MLGLGGALIREPLDAIETGRMAVIGYPSGAVFALLQAGRNPGSGQVNKPVSLF